MLVVKDYTVPLTNLSVWGKVIDSIISSYLKMEG